ncbi:putative transcription factor MYB-HB-like family [Medicago truncatula]|uniref:Homeodomain-related n=1 Tax=Medicago truncatula TaxID=3880 RepID=Q2HW39_MEDTR|nr:Homeodomain-related [Medicago truncatula]RHN80824.1 putative transcription factor MYB-HB-like family [Medicago truncatula]
MSNSNGSDTIKLKKGAWSLHEDAILKEYVRKYGEGNWDDVKKKTELFRCGKSCRLRWLNHLHPDLKKGSITREEEQKIVELHAKIGPKWSLMVQELPGRTDNEIKNFWNIRTRKRTKLGLPLYDQIIKPHDHELNVNRECTLSNKEQADDVSHEVKFKNDIFSRKCILVSNGFEPFHASITQPHFSNMLCNNVANTSPTLTNTDETPFMTNATESYQPQFQGCNSKCYKIVEELPGRRGNEIDNYHNIRTKKRARASLPLYDQIINLCDFELNDINGETCLDGLSNQHQAHVSQQVHKSDTHGSNFEQLSNSCASISNSNTSPTLSSRGAMESDLSPFPECLDFQSSDESQLHSYSLIHKYPLLPLRSEIPHPMILEHSNANQMHSSETRLKDWLMKMERNQFLWRKIN